MTEDDRRYQATVHYLQHKLSALEAAGRAGSALDEAHAALTAGGPAIRLLEAAVADIQVALREARGMANLDDSAIGARGEPAA